MINKIITLAGFSSDIFSQCDESTKTELKAISWVVLVTASLSAFISGMAFQILFDSILVTVALGVCWWFFIIGFDRLIILGNSSNRVINVLRVISALIIALLHSFVVDTVIFDTEIKNLAEDRNESLIKQEALGFDNAISEKETLIEEYKNSMESKLESINEAENNYLGEADGTKGSKERGIGGLAKIKETALMNREKRLKTAIALDSSKIELFEQEIVQIKSQKASRLVNLQFDPSSIGLLERTDLLHQVIKNGSLSTKAFALTWFLIIMLIECLPLIAKHSVKLSEYNQIKYLQSVRNLEEVNARINLESSDILSELQADFAARHFKRSTEQQINNSEMVFDEIKSLIDQHVEACEYWYDRKTELEDKIKEEFSDLGQPMFDSTKKKIVDII